MAYLILYKNMSAMEAVKMIKTERDILPNNSNLAHLATIHNEVRRENRKEATVNRALDGSTYPS